MRINTNVASMVAWRNLSSSDNAVTKSLERLSSGLRINRAADDVAGLAISEGMRSQIRGLNQAVKNAQDGTSLVQTAEASLAEVHTMLQRMRELALQSANGTLQPEDRVALQTEMDQLATEITRATGNVQFNNLDLLDGSLSDAGLGNLSLMVGANGSSNQIISLGIQAMDAKSLGIARDVLTGVVDNGAAVEASASGSVAREILDVGEGVVPGKYRLAFSTPPDAVQLVTESGEAVGTAALIDPADNGIVTVGDPLTGQTLTIQLRAGTLTNGQKDLISVRPREEAVSTVGKVGAGIEAGQYQVSYDPSQNTVQLLDKNGNAIGTPKAAVAGQTVVVGDSQSGRTVELTLKQPLPASQLTDHIWLGTPVARVKGNPPPSSDILAPYLGSGNIGAGLADGTYNVFYDAAKGTVQLQTLGGVAIGQAQAYVPGATLTLGDSVTGQTLSVTLADPQPAGSGKATVQVLAAGYAVSTGVPVPAGASALWDRVIAAGPNMMNGNYTLSYDATAKTVTLTRPGAGGASVTKAFDPTQMEMTLDFGAGEWFRFVLPSPPPTGNVSTTIPLFNSPSATRQSKVVSNPAPAATAILPTSGGAITSVGPNLESGLYRVAYDAATGMFQLQDLMGNGIGQPQAAGAGNVVTLGDVASGRMMTLNVNSPIDLSGFATVEVTNNDGAAEAAMFNGGEKVSLAHAEAGLNISSADAARAAVAKLDAAIDTISQQRAQLGATQNRLEHTVANLEVVSENITAAESRIRDVDMAQEMTTLVKQQILMQSTSAMMAQANQKQQLVLSLLKQ